MSDERDSGLQALQNGDALGAVQFLERAIQRDPGDYLAHLYLGAAYGKADRHSEAIEILTQAVQLQPSSAQARYNLGIALESAGWRDQALGAVQQALQLQPDYPIAKEAERRLQAPLQVATPPPPAVAPQYAENQTMQAPYQQPAQGLAGGVPQPGLGYMPPQPTAGYAPQSAGQAQGYNQPYTAPVATDLAGNPLNVNQTQSYPPPAYNQPLPYGKPGPYNAGGAYKEGYGTVVEDKFDLLQGFKDFGRIITSPVAFFQEQVGRTGLAAPMAFWLLAVVIQAVGFAMTSSRNPMLSSSAIMFPMLIGFAIALLVLPFVSASLLHVVGSMFGNSASYSGTFRAVVYANGPGILLGLLAAIITFAAGTSSSPLQMTDMSPATIIVLIIQVVILVWGLILLITGLSAIQQISGGAAFGEIFIAGILLIVLAVIVVIALAVLLPGLAAQRGLSR